MILVDSRRIQRMLADGFWGTRTLFDALLSNVARFPDQEAVVDPPDRATFTDGAPRRLTWSELLSDVEHLSAVLYQYGLRRDDIVVVQLPNFVEQVVTYLACHRLGIVVSPLPPAYREHEIGHALHLTHHLFGDDKNRGPALIDLTEFYKGYGLEMRTAAATEAANDERVDDGKSCLLYTSPSPRD